MAPRLISSTISEWLQLYKSLPEAEVAKYASTLHTNEDLIASLHNLFDEPHLLQEVVDPVCHQLFEFYRSGYPELTRFSLEFVPHLIMTYLIDIANNNTRSSGGIEACLLGIYNMEVGGVVGDGNLKMASFTIPTLSCPSMYHIPPSLATLALTQNPLIGNHRDQHVVINAGTASQVSRITAQNRLAVMTYLMSCYNRDIALYSPSSHKSLCQMCSLLVKIGFENDDDDDDDEDEDHSSNAASTNKQNVSSSDVVSPSEYISQTCSIYKQRITLSGRFLLEMLSGLYFVMFNGEAQLATQGVEAIAKRAAYELLPDVLLVTTAIKHSLIHNPSSRQADRPVLQSINKVTCAITNATFRPMKLPDDIDAPVDEDESTWEVGTPKGKQEFKEPIIQDKYTTHKVTASGDQLVKSQSFTVSDRKNEVIVNGNDIESGLDSNCFELQKAFGTVGLENQPPIISLQGYSENSSNYLYHKTGIPETDSKFVGFTTAL